MEVKIGVQNASRELVLESTESTDDVQKAVSEALSGDSGLLVLGDAKGRRLLVPIDKLAYVEIGTSSSGQVGFRSRS